MLTWRHPRLERLGFALGLSLVLGCASSSGMKTGGDVEVPGSRLPKREALAKITSVAPQAAATAKAGHRVPSWTLEAPLATKAGLGPPRGQNTGELLLAQLAESSGGAIVYDEALACVSHQLGRFVSKEGKVPIQPLLSFMRHRCGSTMIRLGYSFKSYPNPPTLTEAQEIVERFGNAGTMGMWSLDLGNQHLLVAVKGTSETRIQPLDMAVGANQVLIEGQTGPREWLIAYANHGDLGVEVCDYVGGAGQSFRLVCPLAASDAGTYVDILVAPPGRLFGAHAARLWLSPNGEMGVDYLSPVDEGGAVPMTNELGPAFVQMVNELRGRKGLSQLREVPAQSSAVAGLLPYYEAARALGNQGMLDEIVLGLMAGWELEEPVLDGNFSSLTLEAVETRAQLLELVLYQPYVRANVLQPDVDRIALAIGTPSEANQLRSALFTTYRLAKADPATETQAFVERVNYLRRVRGRTSAGALASGSDTLAQAGAAVARGKATPTEAINAALEHIASQNPGKKIQGLTTFVQDLSKLEMPKELLAEGQLELAVHVELVQSEDSPWASMLVLVAYVDGS